MREYKQKKSNIAVRLLSGWQDSNLRPPAPKAGAITELRYTPKASANIKLILSFASDIFQIECYYFEIAKNDIFLSIFFY
jgi:hypothetical protein